MRNNLPSVQVLDSPKDLYTLLTSDEIVFTYWNFINDEVAEVRSIRKEEFAEIGVKSNVVIAAFTTAQARL